MLLHGLVALVDVLALRAWAEGVVAARRVCLFCGFAPGLRPAAAAEAAHRLFPPPMKVLKPMAGRLGRHT